MHADARHRKNPPGLHAGSNQRHRRRLAFNCLLLRFRHGDAACALRILDHRIALEGCPLLPDPLLLVQLCDPNCLLPLGFHFGVSGMVTFPKADNVREALKEIPNDRLLVETDTPFLAPVPHRGKRNEPAFVVEVAERLAAERGLDRAAVAAATGLNFGRLFAKSGAEANPARG